MPDEMTDEERLASEWLRSRGYEPEFKPKIVTQGRSPDFLAQSSGDPSTLWVEAKTLDPEGHTAAMGRAWDIIQATDYPTDLRGFATMHVNDSTRDQSVRAVLKLFSEHAESYRNENVRLIFIQQVADVGGIRRVDFNDMVPPIRFWIRGAGTQPIAIPLGVMEDGLRTATISDNGVSREIEAYKIFDWNAEFNCALVATLDSKDLPLSVTPNSGGNSSVAPRVLSALENANGQIKNANRYISAPGVVLIFPPRYSHVDNFQIAAGAYGKLMFSFDVPSGRAGPLEHGPNAAFQSQKNRHISAAIRLYRDGSTAMYFPNRFAHRPLGANSPLLAGLECYPPAAP